MRAALDEALEDADLVLLGLGCDQLVTSPLVRARQTAGIAVAEGLAAEGSPTLSLRVDAALAPGGDPLTLVAEFQRAALASKLLATLPPVLHDADDGVAEALRRDADLDADPVAGMSAAEFRTAVAASRR